MIYTSLTDYYKNQHAFKDYKYSIEEIENMIPFERELTIELISQDNKKTSSPSVEVEPPMDDF